MPEPPRNPDFEDAVRQSFGRQSLMRLIGAELERVGAGEVVIALRCDETLMQQSGVVHAGAIAAIADSACGYAALSFMPRGSEVVSVEFKLNLLAPARGERLEARARVVRSGGTLSVCAADVVAIEGGAEVLVATMLATMMRRESGSSPSGT